ncbi:DBH-like monooxygenase protein 2 homolog [Hypanus sabinus]|uniref:DBH-like monooxygenase protein 2 homolog n=1 Tax=Hypanus sabinus TaxID=79690 RepID=UPI0028C3F055|nr:DBH-like monooxygenase protein 2 homolog [Hypanus sabinus]
MDYSGFRLHLTPELRRYDAGILWTGIALFHTLLIPAPVQAYRTYGYCDTGPLTQSPNQTVGPLKVIGGYLHTHLLGSKLRVLRFRAGKQIGVVLQDQTFDPALQEPKFLLEPATVERGDVLITECTFNTMQRAKMVMGGLDTVNEMCMSFLVYYPRIDIEGCLSFQNTSTVAAALGVTASSDDELYRILDARSWNAEQAADMEARVRDASQSLFIVADPDIREGQVKMPEIPKEETTPCVRTLDAGAPARTGLPVALLLTALVSWVCCGGV